MKEVSPGLFLAASATLDRTCKKRKFVGADGEGLRNSLYSVPSQTILSRFLPNPSRACPFGVAGVMPRVQDLGTACDCKYCLAFFLYS